ncbi:MAG: methionine adenosyltransferase [Muribaculaceae bacterium]|nr:methionine adenosyltransferase [Muribaculaceae bacterium]
MNYLFTSESVSEGHPDKVADQISDAVLDEFLARDPQSKVACETMVTTGQIIVAGEIRSEAYIDIMNVAREVACTIGYDRSELGFDGSSCGVLLAVHEQSPDINRGVDREQPEQQGAGDQGMMFGYATDETPLYIPLTLALSHAMLMELADIRREGVDMTYLRPDSKSQVTVEYTAEGTPVRVDTIVISTQHDEFVTPASSGLSQAEADARMQEIIARDVRDILLPRVIAKLPENLRHLIGSDVRLLVNPTGKFVVGGPNGDTGLTGRKIIVDTYGGHGAHGGGAFSGKDPSKVDRSAAYAARHIAKNLVAAGVAERALVQVAYAIGVAEPVSLNVNTFGTAKVNMTDGEISRRVSEIFDMRPHSIETRLKLRAPIYRETATYGHMGRTPRTVTKTFKAFGEQPIVREVELFTWEKLDMVDPVKKAFGL